MIPGDLEYMPEMIDALAVSRRAQKIPSTALVRIRLSSVRSAKARFSLQFSGPKCLRRFV